ncbi:MAG: SDR family oxidoreductase [Kofleriaceae bacterium]
MNDSLRESSVWVTGSSRGIGAAIAKRLAGDGMRVAIHGRDPDRTRALAAELGAIAVLGDVTVAVDVERMRGEIEHQLGPIGILVANAGGNLAPPSPLELIDEAAWRRTIDANLTATFLTIKSVLPGMKRRGRGVIVTISSAAGRRASAMSPIAYSAAKAGIELMTQSIAAQAGPAGVRAVCIAPETILTEANQQRIPTDVQTRLIAEHPIRRLGTPDDVAAAVAFLVSHDASWISGITMDVAGGATLER